MQLTRDIEAKAASAQDEAGWAALLKGPVVILFVFFIILMIKTAWIGDDAFISFRPLDNLLNGYGLRWNVSERVQVYTDPAWLMLVTFCYSITHEIFLTVIALSMAVSGFAVLLLVRQISSSHAASFAGLAILISSKAFIDYTTSGLENALGYLLAAVFCVCLLRSATYMWKFKWLVFLTALAGLNRLDAVLLFLPATAWVMWRSWRIEKVALPVLFRRGFLWSFPLWGWILFSLIYFGFAFPNTYYAKLYTTLPRVEVLTQGILYYFNSFDKDPVTLIALGYALGMAFASRDVRLIAAAAGILAYLFYVVSIGGDFMSGRFFSVPLMFGIALLISMRLRPAAWLLLAALFTAIGLLPRYPSLLTNETYGWGRIWNFSTDLVVNSVTDPRGIADERAAFYQKMGLLPVLRHDRVAPTHPWRREGLEARNIGRHIVVFPTPGIYGFYAGPEVHILDTFALGDPLLSKLPISYQKDWRIGHFMRDVPGGYIETLQTGLNIIEDPAVKKLYASIKMLTRDKLWSLSRFKEIAKMNLGFYDNDFRRIVSPRGHKPIPPRTVYRWFLPGGLSQTGGIDVPVEAKWGRETDASGGFWWTDRSVRISFALPKQIDAGAPLLLPFQRHTADANFEFWVNGKVVEPEPTTPREPSLFTPMRLRGPWRTGKNVIEIWGAGEPAPGSEGDGRRLLFAVRLPEWEQMAESNQQP